MPPILSLAVLAIAWAAYFALHSLLAGDTAKGLLARFAPRLAARYRLLYNAVALATLAVPLALQWRLAGEPLWATPGPVRIALDLTALGAVAAFLWTLRWYDGGAFLGLRRAPQSTFTLSPLHRHVRHPWYFLALLVIWTRPLDAAWLVACTTITAYLIIGSRLEDRRLVAEFGEPYRRYIDRVPGLWPLPGRSLTAAEAQQWSAASPAPDRPG